MMEKIDNAYQEIVKSIIDFVGDSIGHHAIFSEEGAAPVRMTGNGQQRTFERFAAIDC
jgi:hypothetical protein